MLQDLLEQFDIAGANFTFWLFKKTRGKAGSPSKYKGHWIETEESLNAALYENIKDILINITECNDYSLLAQNNENSVLVLDAKETDMDLITSESSSISKAKKIEDEHLIENTDFFGVSFILDGEVFFSFTKTDASWRTKKRKTFVDMLFQDNTLIVDNTPKFSLPKRIDFYLYRGNIYIYNKINFESILSYREAHQKDFIELKNETEFQEKIKRIDILSDFVGSNKIHLRRMCSIRQKGYYRNKNFMENLRNYHQKYGLNLEFDIDGNIICTQENCRDVITALLDHRLLSVFSENIYDVPDATVVA